MWGCLAAVAAASQVVNSVLDSSAAGNNCSGQTDPTQESHNSIAGRESVGEWHTYSALAAAAAVAVGAVVAAAVAVAAAVVVVVAAAAADPIAAAVVVD